MFATLTLQRACLRSSHQSVSPYPRAEQEKVYLSNKPVQTDALLPRSWTCSLAPHNLPVSYQVKSEWTDRWLSKEAISSSSGSLPARRATRHSPAEPPGRLPRRLTGGSGPAPQGPQPCRCSLLLRPSNSAARSGRGESAYFYRFPQKVHTCLQKAQRLSPYID